MDQLLQLDLSYNKIVKLSKTAFSSLHNVNDINLSFNFIKKLTPQIFAPAIDLMYLTVDKMASYKSLSTSIPSLVTLGLSTKSWSCSVLKNVTAVVNSQKVVVKFNQLGETIFTGHFFGPYTENLAGFACQINSTTINTIKKKATFSDMMFR